MAVSRCRMVVVRRGRVVIVHRSRMAVSHRMGIGSHTIGMNTSCGSGDGSRGAMSLCGEAFSTDLVHGQGGRTSVVDRGKGVSVMAGCRVMAELSGGRLNVMFIHSHPFFCGRLSLYAAGTIETRVIIDRRIVDHGSIHISIMYDGRVNIHDCRVIAEYAAAPAAAYETNASISVTVVNTSIVSYVYSPVSSMPAIDAACIAPVAGGPQITGGRRGHPDAGYPIITVDIIIGPVAGYP